MPVSPARLPADSTVIPDGPKGRAGIHRQPAQPLERSALDPGSARPALCRDDGSVQVLDEKPSARHEWGMVDKSLSQRVADIVRRLRNASEKAGRWLSEPGQRVENAFLVLFFVFLTFALGGLIAAFTPIWTPFDQDYWFGDCERVSRAGQNLACQDPSERSEIIRNLLFAFAGGTGAIFGLFQLHNSAKRTRISDDEARISFEAERNERFVKAAQLLKEESPAVQMAAINAFERLALEDRANYRETVISVLAGFIRAETGPFSKLQKNASQAVKEAAPSAQETEVKDGEENGRVSAQAPTDEKAKTQPKRPTESVTEAIKALSVLTKEGLSETQQITAGKLVDLRSCWLQGLDHPDGHCANWNLQRAELEDADLERANLRDANLRRANLVAADLERANLWGANLRRAKLGGADLERANLRDANLRHAELRGTNLRRAVLVDADLEDADLEHADLKRANLGGADLDFTRGVKTEQLAEALYVTWPDHVNRPAEGRYSEAWEAEQAAKRKAASSTDGSEREPQGPEAP
ncbi:MAG: pentapeptide repeat-containing protein [Pseudomonadota bacterium]